MGDSAKTPEEELASGLGSFLGDPKTTGGSYSSTAGNGLLRNEIGKYIFEYDFINERKCEVSVTNGSRIEETIEIAYINNTPNYEDLFRRACGLAKKLTINKR